MTDNDNQVSSRRFTPGDRVHLTNGHPWAGFSGEFVAMQRTPMGIAYLVRLDNDTECMVFETSQIRAE